MKFISTVIETIGAAICLPGVPYPFPPFGSAQAHATLTWLDLTHDPEKWPKIF